MSVVEAIFLGILQGLTEFLPISSSGHLVLVPALLGLPPADLNLIAVTHGGTLAAVLVYFWRDFWRIGRGMAAALVARRPLATPDARLGWYIGVGSIPIALAGLLLKSQIDAVFAEPVAAALFLIVTAALLVVGERLLRGRKQLADMRWGDALLVGLVQTVALLPGISRSGVTIVGGLATGLDRATAARYSFLLGTPAILGATALSLLDLRGAALAAEATVYAAAVLAAAVVGFLCIHLLLAWLRRGTLYGFAVYCAVAGLLLLLIVR